MKIHLFIALVFGLVLVMITAGQTSSQSYRPDSPRQVALYNLLAELGERNGVFFTIEDCWIPSGSTNFLELQPQLIPAPPTGKLLQDQLDEIRQAAHNFTYQFDQDNPRVVHVIDARLLRQEGYPLNGRLKRIDFRGNVNELLRAIAEQGVPISQPQVLVVSEAAVQDYSTIVAVKGTRLRVRAALSNFIPLDRRVGRILWISETRIGRKETSYVRFVGRSK